MSIMPAVANSVWLLSSLPAYLRFRRRTAFLEQVQRKRLRQYLWTNRHTEFGKAHGFENIRCWEEYQDRVPAQPYESLAPYIERIAAGQQNVLTVETVRKFEPTAGSTGAEKWIPYTGALHKEFRRAISVWIAALYLRDPALMSGRAYWSLTPRLAAKERASAVPVGFEDDREYLGGIMGRLLDHALIMHPALAKMEDMSEFWHLTLLLLLRNPDLRLISVWHPSYLELLAEHLVARWPDLLRDLRNGYFLDKPKVSLAPDPQRERSLAAIGPRDLGKIWPELRLISCWTDAAAGNAAERLGQYFPGVRIQPKGLVATEAFVSIPIGDRNLLAYDSHVFEFLDVDGTARPPWAVREGEDYTILVTTGGGLYRYALNDRVRVDAIVDGLPALTFLGKEGGVSDRVGEKLSEIFVGQCLQDVFGGLGLDPRFAMLAFEGGSNGAEGKYVLFLDAGEFPERLGPALDAALRRNPYYDNARQLGQLSQLAVHNVSGRGLKTYTDRMTSEGMRVGDIKPTTLSRLADWRQYFSVKLKCVDRNYDRETG